MVRTEATKRIRYIKMDKQRAVELLIQEVSKIPYLRTLPAGNDEFHFYNPNKMIWDGKDDSEVI